MMRQPCPPALRLPSPTETPKNSLPFPGIYDILPLAVEKLQRPRPPDGKVEEASPGFPGPIHGALAQLVGQAFRTVAPDKAL